MKRFRVIALWVLGVVAVLLLAGWFGLKAYLSGSGGRDAVAAQLTESLGLPVEVQSLDVGVGSTTAALRIPDQGAEPPGDLLRVGSLNTDLSLGGMLGGKTAPTRVTAQDVELLLRIDENGKLLSPLPTPKPSSGGGTLPAVNLSAVTVRIRQTGRPEFVLTGLSGELKREGDGYVMSGNVDDPNWGKWTLSGKLANDPADGRVELTTARGRLDMALIRTIPYVPPEVWDHLQASGETPAAVRFTFKPGADLGYAVELNPTGAASVTVPDVDATATNVKGNILIADGKVAVSGGSLAVADGTIGLNGAYTFDKPTAEIDVKVTADKLDIRKLPAKWQLPREVEGKLKTLGDPAHLIVLIPPEGKLETRGSGKGVVEGAKWNGFNAEVTLRLTAKDGGYKFDSGPPAQ